MRKFISGLRVGLLLMAMPGSLFAKTNNGVPLDFFDDPTSVEQISKDRSDAKSWQKLRCEPVVSVWCNGMDCKKTPPTPGFYLILDRSSQSISICNKERCDAYEAAFSVFNLFTDIQETVPSGIMVKVLGNRKYMEYTTLGFSTSLTAGTCKETP